MHRDVRFFDSLSFCGLFLHRVGGVNSVYSTPSVLGEGSLA